MKKTIEFATTTPTETAATPSPWSAKSGNGNFEDRVLTAEYSARRLRFKEGANWFRIVPAIEPSAHGWMMAIYALEYPGGRFAHPKTLTRNARSAFDHAYAWARTNYPQSLFSKENRKGTRLLTDPFSLFWVLVEEEDKVCARLLVAGGYDGSRGGTAGLGFQIWKAAQERDENGRIVVDAVDPTGGLRLCVEKTQAKGAKYPSYHVKTGRTPQPMDPLLERMPHEELMALCSLENTIQRLSEEEEWHCLERCIAVETVAEIRKSLRKNA